MILSGNVWISDFPNFHLLSSDMVLQDISTKLEEQGEDRLRQLEENEM